jgi:hypothetical protein
VAKWAKFFQVTRNGYYSYIKRRNQRANGEKTMRFEISRIFKESDETYDPERICGEVCKEGKKASYRKVSQRMSEMGLQSIHNRHKKARSLTDSRKSRGEGFPNLILTKDLIAQEWQ